MVKNKKDYLSKTLICQFIVCGILFGSLWGLKQTESNIYYSLKNGFYSNINENFNIFEKTTEEKNITANDNTNIQVTENEIIKSDIDESITETETNKLDVKIAVNNDKIEETPDNISVNSYVLNQHMVVPVNGEITSPFGFRNHPITGEKHFHAGIDIAADSGTPIYAAFSGKVVVADYDKWNGNYIKIQHENNIMTVYCHCEKLSVKTGDYVSAGYIIGTVGSTGSSTGPHLHFEFRVNNISYDPQTALNEAINAV